MKLMENRYEQLLTRAKPDKTDTFPQFAQC